MELPVEAKGELILETSVDSSLFSCREGYCVS